MARISHIILVICSIAASSNAINDYHYNNGYGLASSYNQQVVPPPPSAPNFDQHGLGGGGGGVEPGSGQPGSNGDPQNPKKTVILAIPVKLALQVPDKKKGQEKEKEEQLGYGASNSAGAYHEPDQQQQDRPAKHPHHDLRSQRPLTSLDGPYSHPDEGRPYRPYTEKSYETLEFPEPSMGPPRHLAHSEIDFIDFNPKGLPPHLPHRPVVSKILSPPLKPYGPSINLLSNAYLRRPSVYTLPPTYTNLFRPKKHRLGKLPLLSYSFPPLPSLPSSYSVLKTGLPSIGKYSISSPLYSSASSPLKVYLPPRLPLLGTGLSSYKIRPLGRYPFIPPLFPRNSKGFPLYRKLF